MSIKETLKKNDSIRKVVKKHKIKKEYLFDYNAFSNYYNDSKNSTLEGVEYKIMLLVHSLEKGMCFKKLRPFGEKKITDLLKLLNEYKSLSDKSSTPFIMGVSIIAKWIGIYDDNNFEKGDIYKKAKDFVKQNKTVVDDDVKVGAYDYVFDEEAEQFKIDYKKYISSRHSVREFEKKPISKEDLDYCIESAILSPTACNRQMVKIYSVKDGHKKEKLDSVIMGLSGFDKNTVNYFVITFDISAFAFYGERNQGYFNAGLVAMNFVNALHSRKIGSCFLQWGNTTTEEEAVKKTIGLPENERIAVVIAAGYYKEKTRIPYSYRKTKTEIYGEL